MKPTFQPPERRPPGAGDVRSPASPDLRPEPLPPPLDPARLLAPWHYALALLLVGLACTQLDPRLYQRLTGEPDLMAGDLRTRGYLLLCTLTFVGAAVVAERVFRRSPRVVWFGTLETPRYTLVRTLISWLTALNLGLTGLALALGWVGSLTAGGCALTLILGWLCLRAARRSRRYLIVLALNLLAFGAVASVNRSWGLLLALTTMFGALLLAVWPARRQTGALRSPGVVTVIVVVFVGLVTTLGVLTAGAAPDSRSAPITPASYNRLSALMNGRLILPDMPWQRGLMCSGEERWREQAVAIKRAGLNPRAVWLTAYGETFARSGWWGCLGFALYGVLAGLLYALFRKQSLLGVLLYPWLLVTLLGLGHTLAFFSGTTLIFLGVGLLVWGLSLFLRRLQRSPLTLVS